MESNLLIMSHKDELMQRSTQLQTEIQEIQQTFELKKEESDKVDYTPHPVEFDLYYSV